MVRLSRWALYQLIACWFAIELLKKQFAISSCVAWCEPTLTLQVESKLLAALLKLGRFERRWIHLERQTLMRQKAVDWLLQPLNCVCNGNSIYEAWHDTTTNQRLSHSHSMSRTHWRCRLLRRLRCGALLAAFMIKLLSASMDASFLPSIPLFLEAKLAGIVENHKYLQAFCFPFQCFLKPSWARASLCNYARWLLRATQNEVYVDWLFLLQNKSWQKKPFCFLRHGGRSIELVPMS